MKLRCSSQGGFLLHSHLANALVMALAMCCTSCAAVKTMAVNQLGNALSGSGTTFSSDDDPEFVASAVPFSLKMMESLLEQSPKHEGLLLSTTSYFTQYGYAFIQQEADELEEKDFAVASEQRDRATRMFKRAWGYGMRGLEAKHPGFEKAFRENPKVAVQRLRKEDVPQIFWTAAAGGLGIRPDQPETVARQPQVEALIDRALELDESYGGGTIHSFLIKYEMNRQGVKGDPVVRSRKHFTRAVELSKGKDAGPYVSLAEAVCVPKQDAKEFEALLKKAIAIDVDAEPASRLSNTVMQRRARWLLARQEELILPPVNPAVGEPPDVISTPIPEVPTTTITAPTNLLLPKP